MSKKYKATQKTPRQKKPSTASLSKEDARRRQSRNVRETFESIVIALILAFLFRTFEAEAFRIPTGSMAPTLQGAHKDVWCPQCNYRYQAGASQEAESNATVVSVTCPICRFTAPVDRHPSARAQQVWSKELIEWGTEQELHTGDRIIVGKYSYDFSSPQRWDVVVFKFPNDAKTNYIKRLVGLPGETVRIYHGDILVKTAQDPGFKIQRKLPDKILAMNQIVHDNHHIPNIMVAKNWPRRWQLFPSPSGGQNLWKEEITEGETSRQAFTIDGSNQQHAWLRYQHFVPSATSWELISSDARIDEDLVSPQLISDFYAYNTTVYAGGMSDRSDDYNIEVFPRAKQYGMHWVGDLTLECEVDVSSDTGELVLDLVKGGESYRCLIDVASGNASLQIPTQKEPLAAATPLQGKGSYRLRFANVDQQLILWVNGKVIPFQGNPTVPYDVKKIYGNADNILPVGRNNRPSDLAPVGIAAKGCAVTARHLRVLRDIYYIADEKDTARYESPLRDYSSRTDPKIWLHLEDRDALFSDPQQWAVFKDRRSVDFPLKKDQFFVLGDNSPESRDGRLWDDGRGYHVARHLLIGKAICVYWPHSWYHFGWSNNVEVPLWPNFSDMRIVR